MGGRRVGGGREEGGRVGGGREEGGRVWAVGGLGVVGKWVVGLGW